MAYIGKLQITKDGRRYWQIQVSMGKGQSNRKARFYYPEGKNGNPVTEKRAINARNKFAVEFENKCKSGEVLSRKQKKEKAEAARAEAAKLKTVKQYAENVFMPAKELMITENARNNYQQFLDNHILPELGDMLLKDVTPAMITELLVNFQQAGYSHSSCIKLYNILCGLFKMAFLDDSIPISPMLKVSRPKQSKDMITKPESDKALTAQEAYYVLSAADQEYQNALMHHTQGFDKTREKLYSALLWKVYIELSADTGARRGEICGLQWTDIDEQNKTISIVRNLQYTPQKGVYIATPKNGKNRVVDIGADTLEHLKALKEEQIDKAKKIAEAQNTTVIDMPKWTFAQFGTNEPIHPQSPTRYFKKFGERHNIPDFHPHLLRHTAASIAITHGADVASVSARLGHSDTAVTLRMYTHANQESIRAAGQTLRDAIASKPELNKEKTEA